MAKKQRATSSKRKGTKSITKKKGKKMNEFMKTLLDAKKKKLESFKYKLFILFSRNELLIDSSSLNDESLILPLLV